MKRKIAVILSLLLSFCLLAACASPVAPDPDKPEDSAPAGTTGDTNQITTGETTADMKQSKVSGFQDDGTYAKQLNVYDQFAFDINQDGTDDTITLYTGAEQDDSGEWAFDDGQEWALVAEIDGTSYALFERTYVQTGAVNYQFFQGEKDNAFHILVTCAQGANISINDYVYTLENGFVKTPVYESNSINLIHSK